MLTNAACTIFEKSEDRYVPVAVKHCFWSEETKLDETKDGLNSVKSLIVRIPLSEYNGNAVKTGNLIAKGNISAAVRSKAELERICPSAYTIVGFKKNDIGSAAVRHWRINGR